ncbi:MAG: VOC family protein [Alphaproteobacteria bacterium]
MPKSSAVPKGYHTVTTFLGVQDALGAIDFARKALDAKLVEKHLMDNGKLMHGEIVIGDTRLMLVEAMGKKDAMPAMLYMYVPDCDATYKKAVKAGAKSFRKPEDQFYGDRAAAVRDKSGNLWWFATTLKKPDAGQRKKAVEDYKKQKRK